VHLHCDNCIPLLVTGRTQTCLQRLKLISLRLTDQIRWVLDQQAVGGAIVGVRLGFKEHIKDNKKTFSFALDDEDLAAIAAVQGKSRDLLTAYGDCGQEYRN
jgi:hypothetical protein